MCFKTVKTRYECDVSRMSGKNHASSSSEDDYKEPSKHHPTPVNTLDLTTGKGKRKASKPDNERPGISFAFISVTQLLAKSSKTSSKSTEKSAKSPRRPVGSVVVGSLLKRFKYSPCFSVSYKLDLLVVLVRGWNHGGLA